jgi:hypothetical protein
LRRLSLPCDVPPGRQTFLEFIVSFFAAASGDPLIYVKVRAASEPAFARGKPGPQSVSDEGIRSWSARAKILKAFKALGHDIATGEKLPL